MLVLMEAPLKAGHSVEPCSETQDWAVAAGSVAARRATASDVAETRGWFWCLPAGRCRWTLLQRSEEGALVSMVVGTLGRMDVRGRGRGRGRNGHVWRRIGGQQQTRGFTIPCVAAKLFREPVWYIFAGLMQARVSLSVRASGHELGGAGRRRMSDSGVRSCNAGRGGEKERGGARAKETLGEGEGIAQPGPGFGRPPGA